jgi:RHS repeat-associated protein
MGTGDTGSRRKYTGHERDEETGVDYMMARYKQTRACRFMSPDPIFDTSLAAPRTWNRYGYVHGDPVNAMDPTGKGIEVPYRYNRTRATSSPGGMVWFPGTCTVRTTSCGPGCVQEDVHCSGDVAIIIPGFDTPPGQTPGSGAGSGRTTDNGEEPGIPKQDPATVAGFQISIELDCGQASSAERSFWQDAIPGSAEDWDAIAFTAGLIGTGFSAAGDLMFTAGLATGVGAAPGWAVNAAATGITAGTSTVGVVATDLSSLQTGEMSVLSGLSLGARSWNARVTAAGSFGGIVVPYLGTAVGIRGMMNYGSTGWPFVCE